MTDRWQGEPWKVMLAGKWSNFNPKEDKIIKEAYEAGLPTCSLTARGQDYVIDFSTMSQCNKTTPPFKKRWIKHNTLAPAQGSTINQTTNNILPPYPSPPDTAIPFFGATGNRGAGRCWDMTNGSALPTASSRGNASPGGQCLSSDTDSVSSLNSGTTGGGAGPPRKPGTARKRANSATMDMADVKNGVRPDPNIPDLPTIASGKIFSGSPTTTNTTGGGGAPSPKASGISSSNNTATHERSFKLQLFSGKVIEMNKISLDITVKGLKERIGKDENLDPISMRLIYAGRQLQDDQNLSVYNIKDGGTMTLLIKFMSVD